MGMTTWRNSIEAEMARCEESWSDIVAGCAQPNARYDDREGPVVVWPSEAFTAEMDRKFDSGYGGEEGAHFTVWTAKRVYFPAGYDGSEWCGSVSRDPDGAPTAHVGG